MVSIDDNTLHPNNKLNNTYGTWIVINYDPIQGKRTTERWSIRCQTCNHIRNIKTKQKMETFIRNPTDCRQCQAIIGDKIRHYYTVENLTPKQISNLMSIDIRVVQRVIQRDPSSKAIPYHLTFVEIGTILNMPTRSASNIFNKAMIKIKKILEEKHGKNIEDYFDY